MEEEQKRTEEKNEAFQSLAWISRLSFGGTDDKLQNRGKKALFNHVIQTVYIYINKQKTTKN